MAGLNVYEKEFMKKVEEDAVRFGGMSKMRSDHEGVTLPPLHTQRDKGIATRRSYPGQVPVR